MLPPRLTMVCSALFLGLMACTPTPKVPDHKTLQNEIMDVELQFAQMVKDSGIAIGFLAFAAEDAVMKRGNALIKGKPAIKAYFASQAPQKESLDWKPDFVEVSAAGDLAYTYGQFEYAAIDSLGESQRSTGFFHTVWKRQVDNTWKFVWD